MKYFSVKLAEYLYKEKKYIIPYACPAGKETICFCFITFYLNRISKCDESS